MHEQDLRAGGSITASTEGQRGVVISTLDGKGAVTFVRLNAAEALELAAALIALTPEEVPS